jgi:hypothetical protein
LILFRERNPDPFEKLTRRKFKMRYLRLLVACCAILVASGCSKSNPLLGKWKLAPNQGNECFQLGAIEFGDKTMTMATPLAPVTLAVTYSRDGDNYLVTAAMGQAFSFQTESAGIKSISPECHLVPNN